MVKIKSFLEENTEERDNVYFFPLESAYYFLFNRNNPTRYVHAYFAITYDQQRQLISELEEKRPEYVIYTHEGWRLDEIPEEVQVPLVVEYLNEAYRPIRNLGSASILKRVDHLQATD